jgi:hypothetical protein
MLQLFLSALLADASDIRLIVQIVICDRAYTITQLGTISCRRYLRRRFDKQILLYGLGTILRQKFCNFWFPRLLKGGLAYIVERIDICAMFQ